MYTYILTYYGIAVPVLRLNSRIEYRGNALRLFATEYRIRLEIIPIYDSSRNGLAEVSNNIVYTIARKLMLYANLLAYL